MRHPSSGFSHVPLIRTPSGSRTKILYDSRFNGRSVSLVQTGSLDTQDLIEAEAPFSDINFILHRLKVGDRSVLSRKAALYGDFSRLPANPIDAINLVQSAEQQFKHLSGDDKEKYNNDFRVWLASMFNPGNVESGDLRGQDSDPDNSGGNL